MQYDTILKGVEFDWTKRVYTTLHCVGIYCILCIVDGVVRR